MKLRFSRSTTSASTSFLRKAILVLIVIVIAVIPSFSLMKSAFADQYDDEINALQQQISSAQAQANQLAGQVSTLQSAVASLQDQQNTIQAQINLSQAQYDQLTAKIAATQANIKENQDALGQTLADMYVNNQVTPLEMLASSQNIGDYLNKQTYRSSISDQLTTTITKIQTLQTQLNEQQAAVKTVLVKQQADQASLAAVQAQQQNLLDQTQGQESAYEQLVASSQQQVAAVSAQQQAYYQSLLRSGSGVNSGTSGSFHYSNWSGNEGCSGGYPYCGRQDSSADPWGLLNRECVSYVAWALVYKYDRQVNPFSGYGNAYEWIPFGSSNAIQLDGSANYFSGATRVSSPQPGDVVVLPPTSDGFAPTGHVMIVDSVNSDGSMNVSQYNFYGTGEYSTMTVQNSGIVLLRFPPQ